MANSERVAVAAHLHVALRRKAGRVTDMDWMAVNDGYAQEIVRFALAKSQELNDPSLAELAAKLEAVLQAEATQKPAAVPLVERLSQSLQAPAPASAPVAPISREEEDASRYVGALR